MHSQYPEFKEELDRLWSKYIERDGVADYRGYYDDEKTDAADSCYAQYRALLAKAKAAQAKRVVMVSTAAGAQYDQEWLDGQQEEYDETIRDFEAGTGRM